MFLVKAGGVVYVDGTKVGRTASMLKDITRVRRVLGKMVEHPEKDRLQFRESKILGIFFFIGESISCTIQHEQGVSSLQFCREGFGV